MPFISASIAEQKHLSTEKIDLSKSILVTNPSISEAEKGTQQMLFRITFENIGVGFAHTFAINSGDTLGGIEFSRLMKVANEKADNSVEIEIKAYAKEIMSHEVSFYLCYIDCMTNEYIQAFTISKRKNYVINSGYPAFIGQTHEICSD